MCFLVVVVVIAIAAATTVEGREYAANKIDMVVGRETKNDSEKEG